MINPMINPMLPGCSRLGADHADPEGCDENCRASHLPKAAHQVGRVRNDPGPAQHGLQAGEPQKPHANDKNLGENGGFTREIVIQFRENCGFKIKENEDLTRGKFGFN